MRVIVNAHDLGISDMVNDSVFELIEERLFSSATIMANGAYGETWLEFVPSFISEWYGWSAYHPESQLYQAGS